MKLSKTISSIIFIFLSLNIKSQSNTIKPLLLNGSCDWALSWQDEFEYENLEMEENWESQNGPSGHILCSRWRENVEVKYGMLRLINKKESRGGQEWTSGNIWTKQQFMYGYFECRYRYAAAPATNNSFWLMTRGKDPLLGKRFEIDINEGHYPNTINTNIHNWSDITIDPVTGKRSNPRSPKAFNPGKKDDDYARDFQVYGLEWNEKELIFYFNGEEIRREKNEFCHSPAPVWLSLAIIPWHGKVTDAIDGTFMEVDYVRVFSKK